MPCDFGCAFQCQSPGEYNILNPGASKPLTRVWCGGPPWLVLCAYSDAEVAALPSGLQPRPVERTLPSIVETWRQAVDTSVTEERELTLDALNNDEFKSTDMPVLPDATAASATVPSPGAKTDLHGLNILVVDDDTVIRKQVKMLLTKFGCKCTVLSDGKKVGNASAFHQAEPLLHSLTDIDH